MATRPLPASAPAAPRQVQRERLRVVRGQARPRRRSPILVVFLVVLTVFGVAAIQAWVGQDGLHAAMLERQVHQEQERLTLLRARVAQLSTPERIRAHATELGLIPDPNPTFLRVPMPPEALLRQQHPSL